MQKINPELEEFYNYYEEFYGTSFLFISSLSFNI